MASPLACAWESAEADYKGLWVLTDTHYSHAFMETGRNNFQDESNPTDAKAAVQPRRFVASADNVGTGAQHRLTP